jgi:MFS family permease
MEACDMTPKRSSAEQGVRPTVLAALMLGLFSVSLGYGAILPMLPDRIARVTGLAGDASALSQTTGILTGLYTAALFVFAPLWGWISDRYGRRKVLVIGLAGFGATMATFSLFEGSMTLYAERFLTGLFAAAIAPVALAIVADLASADEERARRQSLVTLAGMAGFLVGPMAGAVLAQSVSVLPESGPFAPQSLPLVATGILSLAASIVVLMAVPTVRRRLASGAIGATVTRPEPHLIWRLLIVSFVVAASVGVVEVGLVLRGQREGLTAYQIATMFSECSLVMFIVQAIVFSPLVKPEATRWLIAPALLVLAVALFLLPRTSDYLLMLALVGAVASSAGILSPIVTYWISSKAGAAQGALLGRQTAAASLGATFGSVAGGVLFDLPYIKDASFLVAAVAVLLGLLAAFGLANLLRPKEHASVSGSSGAQR